MRSCAVALACVVGGAVAACGAQQHGADPACTARWEQGEVEVRDTVTNTWDAVAVDAIPLWKGDLDHDGRADVILRYRGSRTHEAIVLRRCAGDDWQVLLDEVRASRIGTTQAADGWLDLELVDGPHRAEYHHGPDGYSGPPPAPLGDEPDWQ